MAQERSVLDALFEWINSLPEVNVQTIDDIADGTVLWKVLGEIDENQFSGALPSPVGGNIPSAAWIRKANNLKHIHSVLADYIIYRCRRKLPLPSGEPDLTAIAQSGSETAAVQLLKLVLLAAVFGRFSMEHIQKLTSLSADTQAQFYLILEEPEAYGEEEKCVMGQDSDQDDGQIATIPENAHETDQDFVYEERIAQLVVVNKRWEQETLDLQEQLENLHDLQTRLQKSYDNLEVQHRDTVERLNALRSGKGEQSMLGIQRTKMQQQETVIATLESQISSLREENIDLKVQNDHLVTQTHDLQPMQDQVFELKIENEQLQRKANAADKYKEKLQSLHKVEEENERLKYRVNEMQRELKQGDSEHFNNSDLRRENDELRRLVSNIEQELSDSIEAKKRAEFEKLTFEAKAQQADEQASRWCGKVQSLQRLLNDDPGSDSTSTPRASTSDDFGSTLYDEMDEQDSGLSKGISDVRLEDQNLITEEELQAVISVMKAHTQYTSVTERSSSIQEQQKLAAKLEKTRAITKELIQQTQAQSSVIASLQTDLASAANTASTASIAHVSAISPTTRSDSNPEPDSRLDEALSQKANLERELQLMASAWYDQNSRLMSNTVSVSMSRGRPPTEPKSFLGRQRRLVDSVLTERG